MMLSRTVLSYYHAISVRGRFRPSVRPFVRRFLGLFIRPKFFLNDVNMAVFEVGNRKVIEFFIQSLAFPT